MQKRRLILVIVSIGCLTCLFASVILGIVGINVVGLWSNKAIEGHNFPLEQQWVYPAEEDIQAITIGSDGQIVARTNSSIFTLNTTNGELMWSATLPKTFGGSAPIISNEIIVVAHSRGTDAYNLDTGVRIWRATDNTKSRGRQAFPAAADGNLVVIVGGFIVVRDLYTGQLLWKVERDRPGGDAWAVIDTDNLYIIFLSEIRSYDSMTGALNWSVETPSWSLQNALLNNNVVYLENTFNDGVGAFDVQTQTLVWQQEGNFTTQSNPLSAYEDYLFVPVDNHVPLGLHLQTGDIIWEASELPDDVYSAAHVIDDIVYVKALFRKKLYAVDLSSGDTIGYLELGQASLFPVDRITSVGPLSIGSSLIFADDERIFAYGK